MLATLERSFSGWLLQGWLGFVSLSVAAQTPAVEWFRWEVPQRVRLSPDGRFVGAVAAPGNGGGWRVWDLSGALPSGNGWTPSFPPGSIIDDFVWTADGAAALVGRNGAGVFQGWVARPPSFFPTALPGPRPSGRAFRLLQPQFPMAGAVLLESYPAGAGSNAAWSDVWRWSLDGGIPAREVQNPGGVGEWLADGSGRVRLALAIRGLTQELRVLPPADGQPWATMMTFDFLRDPARLLGIAADGQRGWFAARLGRDTRGVYEIDLAAQRVTRSRWHDDRFDFGAEASVVAADNALAAVNFDAARPHTDWLPPTTAWPTEGDFPIQPRSLSLDGRRGLFWETRAQLPGQWVWRERTSTAGIALSLPGLAAVPTGQALEPVSWTARDGVTLTGYWVRPKANTEARPPLAVLAHGGPWARDRWEWRPEAQFLADRGWAVLLVNYRGSAGFGWEFQQLGAGRWNQAADDLIDGARWTVTQGWTDPNRQVIAGSSFGGFLAAMALTRPGQPFRAGVSIGGVFDLPQWLRQARRTEPAFTIAAQRQWLMGTSPSLADGISVPPRGIRNPLMLIHARDDERVALSQSVEFAEELRDLGIPFVFETLPSGGHALGGSEQRAQVWTQVEEFLRRGVGLPTY